MIQSTSVPATPLVERLRTGAGRRTLAIGLALLIEALLLLLVLSFGSEKQPAKEQRGITVVNLQAEDADEAPEPSAPEPEQRTEEQPAPERPPAEEVLPPQPSEPLPPRPADPIAPPVSPAIVPAPGRPPAREAAPSASPPAPSPRRRTYGPPAGGGGSSSSGDTERVGTAPNGEPLYAAAWYREPRDSDLRAYLSTASGPGWGLIACRTVPDYRVEDCVGLSEYPEGSQINRALLAAAWEFRVRPPRRGGRPLVGSWVRIRIDYSVGRR